MPDLNSLPPSQTPPSSRSSPISLHRTSLSPQIPSPLSRSPTNPAPTSTAGPQPPTTATSTSTAAGGSPRIPRSSPRIERRRSSLLRDWSLNDNAGIGSNAMPSPNEPHTASSQYQHRRAPSLGELHQELENEQEAQVNRLLAMIRQQQAQIQQSQLQLQAHAQTQAQYQASPQTHTQTHAQSQPLERSASSTAAVASSTPGSSHPPSAVSSRPQSLSIHQQHSQQHQSQGSGAMPPPPYSAVGPGASSTSRSRQSSSSARRDRSRTNSHASSPALRPHDGGPADWALPGIGMGRERDEVAFYQAETAMVQRENQMLKGRIRELERLVQGLSVDEPGAAAVQGQT